MSEMRKIIVSEFVTLDSVMEAPGGTPKKMPLELLESKPLPNGVVVQTCARALAEPVADLSIAALCADPSHS